MKSYDLEVVDGVNLDSDNEMEAVLAPQIPNRDQSLSKSWVNGRSRPSSINSLKHQSETQRLLRSHQDHGYGDSSDSECDSGHNYHDKQSNVSTTNDKQLSRIRYQSDYDQDQEPRYVEHITVSQERLYHGEGSDYEQDVTRYEERSGRSRNANTRSVIFGGDTINNRIHEEFRQRAKRNESFKIALSSPKVHRRGSMAESLRQSMEDLQDGFVSLSGRSSKNGSIRSRSSSVGSLNYQESYADNNLRKHSTSSSNQSYSVSKSQEQLNRGRRNDVLSRSAAGLDKLSRGMGPRRSSRDRNKRRNTSRSRSASREKLGRNILGG